MICVASRFDFGRLRFPAEWPAPFMIPRGFLMAWALKIPALAWKDLPFLLEEINVISQ
jgi:hypothetical protein